MSSSTRIRPPPPPPKKAPGSSARKKIPPPPRRKASAPVSRESSNAEFVGSQQTQLQPQPQKEQQLQSQQREPQPQLVGTITTHIHDQAFSRNAERPPDETMRADGSASGDRFSSRQYPPPQRPSSDQAVDEATRKSADSLWTLYVRVRPHFVHRTVGATEEVKITHIDPMRVTVGGFRQLVFRGLNFSPSTDGIFVLDTSAAARKLSDPRQLLIQAPLFNQDTLTWYEEERDVPGYCQPCVLPSTHVSTSSPDREHQGYSPSRHREIAAAPPLMSPPALAFGSPTPLRVPPGSPVGEGGSGGADYRGSPERQFDIARSLRSLSGSPSRAMEEVRTGSVRCENRPCSIGEPVLIGGVLFTPRTPTEQRLADEILGIRRSLSEDRNTATLNTLSL